MDEREFKDRTKKLGLTVIQLRTYPKIRATPLPPGDKSPGYQRKVRLSGLNSQVLAVFRRLWMNSPDIHVRAEWRKIFFG